MFDFEIDLDLSTFAPRAMPTMPCAIWTARKCLAKESELKYPKDDVVAEDVAAPDHALDPGVVVVADVVAHIAPDSHLKSRT